MLLRAMIVGIGVFAVAGAEAEAGEILSNHKPARLDIRSAGEYSIRVTLKPLDFTPDFPFSPALAERADSKPVVSLTEISRPIKARVGIIDVEVQPSPLSIVATRPDGSVIQTLVFQEDGDLTFRIGGQPILGLGEGGPAPKGDFRALPIEFDRRGRFFDMRPRWQSDAYGSRNPVALFIGTEGWGLFIASPWGQADLRGNDRGVYQPWLPPATAPRDAEAGKRDPKAVRDTRADRTARLQGRPPVESLTPGLFDVFVFDARDPMRMMKDIAAIAGPAVMPPKWSLGYMQSHRELADKTLSGEALMLNVVDTFRKKRMPLDAVIYLGTGFTPTGWNTRQPSFQFNPKVFERNPKEVLDDLHARHVKVIVHVVPWQRDRLPGLQGTIPAKPAETLDASHIENYWKQHIDLVRAGIDAWWPDEGDWFNLFERVKRHQLYYQGPLQSVPNLRPWSLHRNGYLGIARWGGWVWSGDTQSTWKTLEGQVAVGINHSLSLSPYWGSDTGGFYTTPELSGELYARWFQFSAFCPSFRSHGRIWRLRLPWGWGLDDMGDHEGQRSLPRQSELSNPAIEPVCRKYEELRYRLIPYTYTLAAEARETGLPPMRAMWLHYPDDERLRGLGTQYLWGKDLLVAPVFKPAAKEWPVVLPKGDWYDWWSGKKVSGPATVVREVDLETMPLYVRAGSIIPLDPVRQFMEAPVDEPTTVRVYPGADGRFRWYEDDGVSQEYLDGKFAWTNLTWDDAGQRLTIEPDLTSGGRMPDARKLLIQFATTGETKEVIYNGGKIEIRLGASR